MTEDKMVGGHHDSKDMSLGKPQELVMEARSNVVKGNIA